MLIKTDHPFQNERLLDYDRINGVRTYFSSEGDNWSVRHDFDSVMPELEASKALARDDDHWKNGVKNSWLHYGHIPDSIMIKWYQMGVDINNPKDLIAMLNKPEWSYLKCTGKIHV